MMKNNIDDTLTRLARRTHAPRGRYAATEQNYQQLLDRIPAETRPVIGQGAQPGRTAVTPGRTASPRGIRAAFARWSAAACLLLVVGIGLAIAGVWYHQSRHEPSAVEGQPAATRPDTGAATRTLVYLQAPLSEIVADLSAIYHTPIQIGRPELRDYCVTATFSTAEPLAEILDALAEIGSFEVRESPGGIVIE